MIWEFVATEKANFPIVYIEVSYNRERLHSTLDYSTPIGYREEHKSGVAA